jgi:hypothetical protein
MERLLGFLYSLFIMTGIIQATFHLLLAIGFVKHGSNNRDSGGIFALIGGFLYLLAYIIFLIVIILSKYGGWYNIAFLISIASIIEIIVWLHYVLGIVAVIMILIYSIFTKRPLFIIFAVLFFVAWTMDFLGFIGVI